MLASTRKEPGGQMTNWQNTLLAVVSFGMTISPSNADPPPDFSAAQEHLGKHYAAALSSDYHGNFKVAISEFTATMRDHPDVPYLYVQRAHSYFEINEFEKCVSDIKTFLSNP